MYTIKTRGEKAFDIFCVVLMVLLAFIFIYPFWDTLMLSLSNSRDAMKMGVRLLPSIPPNFDAYRMVFKEKIFLIAVGNSVFRTVVGTVWATFWTFTAAFVMAKKTLPFRGVLTGFMAFTMFFGGGLIPSYMVIKNLGLLGSRLVWILPGMTGIWDILIARNFIMGLPEGVEEATVVDGASVFAILFRVVMPMSTPVLGVLALWNAVGSWNAWYDAYLYTNTEKLMLLQLLLRRILVDSTKDLVDKTLVRDAVGTTPETVKAATIVVTVLPIACTYPFFQRYFVKGINVGSIKG